MILNNLYFKHFSHIYVEKDILNHQISKEIITKYKDSHVITISDYKEVFNTSSSDFIVEKQSLSLILAQKKENFIYKGSRFCDNYNFNEYFYTNIVLNCLFDCEYCFLKGMHNRPYIVLFVNIDKLEKEIKGLEKNSYISLSYETDILAFNNSLFNNFVLYHYNLIKNNFDKTFEIRTKSRNINFFLNNKKLENLIISFTLSPEEVIRKYEKNTANLNQRIDCINKLIEKGYKVRICFDPLLYIENHQAIYGEFFRFIKENIDCNKIFDFSVGTFRISEDYFKKMKRNSEKNDIICYPYCKKAGYYGYSSEVEEDLINNMLEFFDKEYKNNKVFIWR